MYISKEKEKEIFLNLLIFHRKRDIPQLTHISINKRDRKQHTHQTG